MSNTRPNIVYILADDMGYGDVGCYNPQSKIPTPYMDRLAREGMRFTDAHSPSAVCTPTRYGVLTGRYCWRTELKSHVLFNYELPLIEPERMTVASLLKRCGYHTGCFGKWHLGLGWGVKDGEVFDFDLPLPWPGGSPDPVEEDKIDFSKPIAGGPVELGFDRFYGTSGCSTAQPPYCFIDQDQTVGIPSVQKPVEMAGGRRGLMVPDWDHKEADPIFTEKAVAYIEERAKDEDTPFFLYLAASAPHEPCTVACVPEFLRGASEAGPRGDMVALFDWMVGQVMDALDRCGLADDTLVLVTSDNGALPGCNGRTYGHKSCGDWRGFKGFIWEGGHREPFIARWPGVVAPNSVCDALVGLQDFMATVADIVGESLPEDAGEDSASFLPALMGENELVRNDLIHHSCMGVFSIRRGDWKLIVDCDNSGDMGRGVDGCAGTGPVPGARGQLYHMGDDPFESYNQFGREPGIVREFREMVERYIADGRSV